MNFTSSYIEISPKNRSRTLIFSLRILSFGAIFKMIDFCFGSSFSSELLNRTRKISPMKLSPSIEKNWNFLLKLWRLKNFDQFLPFLDPGSMESSTFSEPLSCFTTLTSSLLMRSPATSSTFKPFVFSIFYTVLEWLNDLKMTVKINLFDFILFNQFDKLRIRAWILD